MDIPPITEKSLLKIPSPFDDFIINKSYLAKNKQLRVLYLAIRFWRYCADFPLVKRVGTH